MLVTSSLAGVDGNATRPMAWNAGRTMIPVAKRFVGRRNGDELLIVLDPRECLRIPDRGGQIEQLLVLLRDGCRTPAGLATALSASATGEPVTESEVLAALEVLDECPTCASAPAS
jgi:hypothetical protein